MHPALLDGTWEELGNEGEGPRKPEEPRPFLSHHPLLEPKDGESFRPSKGGRVGELPVPWTVLGPSPSRSRRPGWPLGAKRLGGAETPPCLQPPGRLPITYWRMRLSRSP